MVLGRIINGFTNCAPEGFVVFVDDLDITGLGLATGTRGGGGGFFRGCFTVVSPSTS